MHAQILPVLKFPAAPVDVRRTTEWTLNRSRFRRMFSTIFSIFSSRSPLNSLRMLCNRQQRREEEKKVGKKLVHVRQPFMFVGDTFQTIFKENFYLYFSQNFIFLSNTNIYIEQHQLRSTFFWISILLCFFCCLTKMYKTYLHRNHNWIFYSLSWKFLHELFLWIKHLLSLTRWLKIELISPKRVFSTRKKLKKTFHDICYPLLNFSAHRTVNHEIPNRNFDAHFQEEGSVKAWELFAHNFLLKTFLINNYAVCYILIGNEIMIKRPSRRRWFRYFVSLDSKLIKLSRNKFDNDTVRITLWH